MNRSLDIQPGTRHNEGALGPYLRAIRAHPLLVAVVTLAAVLASVAWVVIRPTEYEATAQMLVNPLPQEDETFLGLQLLRDSGDPTRTVQTAATLVESSQAATATAKALGDDWTANRVLDDVSVNPEGESNILSITATADDARLATRLADTFAKSSIEARRATLEQQAKVEIDRLEASQSQLADGSDLATRIDQLERVRAIGDPTLALSQPATVPSSSTGTSALVIILLAAIAGFTLGSGAALILELTARRIRDEDEMVGLYALPILARVPILKDRELHHGPGDAWLMPPAVREAFRVLLVQLGERPRDRAKVVMVTSGSPGDGKTTSAINLAASMATGGDKVVLVDFDLRKPDVAANLGIRSAAPVARMLQPDVPVGKYLASAKAIPNLSVLSVRIPAGDTATIEAIIRRMPEIIEEVGKHSDFVVVDTAPLGQISDALRLVGDVDDVIVVTRPGTTNRNDFETMRDLLERSGHTPVGLLVIGDAHTRGGAYYAYGETDNGRQLFAGDVPRPAAPTPRTPR